jgi:hypothetical protein
MAERFLKMARKHAGMILPLRPPFGPMEAHFTGERFRHGTRLLRWRPDKAPAQCTLDQVKRQKKANLMALLK